MSDGETGTETAWAKINLALHVRRRRADGYHDIETLFAFCEDGDMLEAYAPAKAGADLAITGNFAAGLDAGPTNLVHRAAEGLRATFGITDGWSLRLDKRLPIASGIGGGSADAAAALRLLCRRWSIDPADRRVTDVAACLGADVPACLTSLAAYGEGKGDTLRPVATRFAGAAALLVNPRVPLATGAVFAAWDGIDRGPLDPADVAAGRNDLETPARRLCPEIAAVLGFLAARGGVTLARMSGSGATCFALFEDDGSRDAAAAAVPQGWWRLATRLRH